MKHVKTILTSLPLVLALSVPVWAQTKDLPTQTTTVDGTIETIDQNERAMNIKTSDGRDVAVNVPESVTKFHDLKVGDHVKATYNNNVSVRLKPPGEAAINTGASGYSKGGGQGTQAISRQMTASIVGLDRAASSIAFEGPNGWKYSRRVVDPTVFDKVKVGDRVDITWNTDVTVQVVS